MRTRKATVIAASVGVAVAAATGVTYASSALESAPQSASIVQDAAPVAPRGGNGTGTEAGSNAANAPALTPPLALLRAAPALLRPGVGRGGNWDEGRIYVNERSYSADPGSCIVVINVNSPLVPQVNTTSFNIRNESDRTVEFYSGLTCDNGAPVATVGPHSSSNSVAGQQQLEPLAVVGSFRVINGHH
ncbi:hypothetical protein [Streptomyces europaeiscabiei]|uniref:hypothetical protein n=1 Tax=Streptomyces europaeiscabiei TaxID=146819 RepID=UPI0029A89472|nr:hypothetical protein [Streptomyces europaeiscabiei]MDX2762367.1 hypothetical protein [Streptomyces europaeiscabiei]